MKSISKNKKKVSNININLIMVDMLGTLIQRIGNPITIFGFQYNHNEKILIHGYNLGFGPVGNHGSFEKSICFSMEDGSLNYFTIDTQTIEPEPTFKIDELNFYFHITSLCKGKIGKGKNE